MRGMIRTGFLCSLWLAVGSCGGGGGAFSQGSWGGMFMNYSSFKSAEFSVTDTTFDLVVPFAQEGQVLSSGCTVIKYRYEFSFALTGDKGTGAWYYSYVVNGVGCQTPQDVHDQFGTLTLRRVDGSGTAPTNFQGSWELADGKGFTAQMTLSGTKVTGSYGTTTRRSVFEGTLTDRTLQAMSSDQIGFTASLR